MDDYFLKSLFSTLLVYLGVLTGLVIFVFIFGIAGAFLISAIVALLLVCFYGGFRRIAFRGKGLRS